MLLTISSTARPATDFGYLLHKHPDRVQSFDVAVGTAHVFYPEATAQRCTAALMLEVDPIELVRSKRFGGKDAFSLAQYVNDRPYAASSMLAVAMGKVFRTAMSGRCDSHPELAEQELPLEIQVPSLPCRGGPELAKRLFEPLGWTVDARAVPLDPHLPEWGDSRYVSLQLSGNRRLADALSYLYVLLPVLDNAKHYWVGPDEVDKLIRAGGGWLGPHPERELITRRYLAHSRRLVSTAVARLAEADDVEPETLDNAVPDDDDAAPNRASPSDEKLEPQPESLAERRRKAVLRELRSVGAARVADLGCGEGLLLRDLRGDPQFTEILGVDVSARALDTTARRLRLDHAANPVHAPTASQQSTRQQPGSRDKITLIQSSLLYRDERIAGYDAVVLMEVIEHVDPERLNAVEQTVFGTARPGTVVVTTPNVEYNSRFEGLVAGEMRHGDHRFEWTRAQFRAWADGVASGHGYQVRYLPVGDEDPDVGPPTQLAVFTRADVPISTMPTDPGIRVEAS